jgi:outer membrane protein assembly factor BamB
LRRDTHDVPVICRATARQTCGSTGDRKDGRFSRRNAAETTGRLVEIHRYCLDKRTGELRWKFHTGSRIESGPAVRDDSVYIPSCDGTLYKINLQTGEAVWRFRTTPDRPTETAIYSAPLLLQDTVCFTAGEGQIYAVDLAGGELTWKFRPSEHSEMYSSPATDGRRIFVQVRPASGGQGENAIIAIDETPNP